MRQFSYVTNRTLVNKAGKESGRMRVMVKVGSTQAEGDYHCPECGHDGKVSQAFKRPFTIRCGKCNVLIRMPRLKNK
ncbi:MAG: hypothetical protein ISS93_03235 [Candidatus Aenigmarchaeota archaeon]|nr:hypothetical protein [Candidatus Aenigmarchaeota archaeon]